MILLTVIDSCEAIVEIKIFKKMKRLNLTDEHHKAMQWCIKNDIKVAVNPTKRGLRVLINERGKKKLSPGTYSQTEANNKVWELYLYIYKKYWNV